MNRLAITVLRAAQIREESFDHDACNEMKKKEKFFDPEKFYKIDLYDACDKAAEEMGYDETGTMPIYLLLKNSWNNILYWAEEIKKEN